MKIQSISSTLIVIVLIIATLIMGQSIIIPFIIALLIWFVVKKMRNLLDKSAFILKYIPHWIKTILASAVIFIAILLIGRILTSNIESLANSYENYASNIESLSIKINELFGINIHVEVVNFFDKLDVQSYLKSIFNSISFILGNMVMIIFYVTFLFVEETLFHHKIKLIFSDSNRYDNVMSIFQKIDKSMSSYISLKSLVNLMSAGVSYLILLAVGIDSPVFWAFLIFIFNFIPSIGPIIGTIFPAVFALIQFGEFTPFLIILFGVGIVVMTVGSIIEPKLMGNTLNISPLVAILALAVWGSIWGITGMLLSVPITVAMIIVFSQFKNTKNLAILLSEKGRV